MSVPHRMKVCPFQPKTSREPLLRSEMFFLPLLLHCHVLKKCYYAHAVSSHSTACTSYVDASQQPRHSRLHLEETKGVGCIPGAAISSGRPAMGAEGASHLHPAAPQDTTEQSETTTSMSDTLSCSACAITDPGRPGCCCAGHPVG